jgi:hypothetical protein
VRTYLSIKVEACERHHDCGRAALNIFQALQSSFSWDHAGSLLSHLSMWVLKQVLRRSVRRRLGDAVADSRAEADSHEWPQIPSENAEGQVQSEDRVWQEQTSRTSGGPTRRASSTLRCLALPRTARCRRMSCAQQLRRRNVSTQLSTNSISTSQGCVDSTCVHAPPTPRVERACPLHASEPHTAVIWSDAAPR